MSGRSAVFDILAKEEETSADHALVAALPWTDRPTAQAIVETLLMRGKPTGLRGLVESFHELDEPLRQMILEEMDRIFSVLREVSQSREEQVRLNMIEVIHRGMVYRAAYLLDTALHDRSPRMNLQGQLPPHDPAIDLHVV